ncbi:MAG: c-type cytochrome [Janthinobacterium lividum]
MSSHFRARAAVAGLALVTLAACNKAPSTTAATTASTTTADAGATAPAAPAKAAFQPARAAGLTAGQIDPRVLPYLNSKPVVLAGMAGFKSHNCNGCHSNGGGGMGPSLMDATWIYGGRIEDIHATIVEGRPNGMPKWGGKIPDEDIWKIAAYVRSMSLPATLAAARNNTPSQDPAPVPNTVETE